MVHAFASIFSNATSECGPVSELNAHFIEIVIHKYCGIMEHVLIMIFYCILTV